MAAALAAANRIRNTRPALQTETAFRAELPLDNEKGQGTRIDFKNVSFKYPTRDVTVLDQLDMRARLF